MIGVSEITPYGRMKMNQVENPFIDVVTLGIKTLPLITSLGWSLRMACNEWMLSARGSATDWASCSGWEEGEEGAAGRMLRPLLLLTPINCCWCWCSTLDSTELSCFPRAVSLWRKTPFFGHFSVWNIKDLLPFQKRTFSLEKILLWAYICFILWLASIFSVSSSRRREKEEEERERC